LVVMRGEIQASKRYASRKEQSKYLSTTNLSMLLMKTSS
jgi:hypothetical protein